MQWPELVTIQLRAQRDKAPLPDHFVQIQVVATEKNNYSLPGRISDRDGTVSVTRDEVAAEIERSWQEHPMDYATPLEGCDSIEIVIENHHDLQERISRLRPPFPSEAEQMESLAGGLSVPEESFCDRFRVQAQIVVELP